VKKANKTNKNLLVTTERDDALSCPLPCLCCAKSFEIQLSAWVQNAANARHADVSGAF